LRKDSTSSFIFFEIVPEMKPLIVWDCHLVILAISVVVAPSLRRSSSITALFFDPSRASCTRPFAAVLACFGAVFAAAGFSPRLTLGAAFFWLALVVALAGAGATAAPCGVTAAVPAGQKF
jgi:hypothetical protein